MDVEEVAARVIYLTDGDKTGSDYLSDLRKAKVPESRLKSLPSGTSIEDLRAKDFLISVIASILPKGLLGPRQAPSEQPGRPDGRLRSGRRTRASHWGKSLSPTRSSTEIQ